jgi:chemotaxis protein methyltransferase CheR
LDALAERLRKPQQAALEREVVEAMTTNETSFFRDGKPFAHLGAHALPRLNSSRPAGVPIRIWSAAASTGQEAYSIAMLAAEQSLSLGGREVEIIGTDIARETLARARDASYTQFEIQRGLPMQLLVKHFRKDGNVWRLTDRIRNMVTFREWNLLGNLRPLGKFDVVFCRNVLIYFDQSTKARALDGIAGQLAADGYLYLGGAESLLGLSDRFVASASAHAVYELAGSHT